jgi:uroporphyrinogen-III synthase
MQSQRFADQLQAAYGPIAIIVSPLIEPEFLSVPLPADDFQALILTSETAAQAAGRLLATHKTLPKLAFCVGDRTADAASRAGFEAVSAKGAAADLIKLILAQGITGPLLHLHGQETLGDIADTLNKSGVKTLSVISYRQCAQPLSYMAIDHLMQDWPLLLPIFSPRTARILGESLPENHRAPLLIAALSPSVANHCLALSPRRLVIADQPNADAMLQAVAELLIAGLGA